MNFVTENIHGGKPVTLREALLRYARVAGPIDAWRDATVAPYHQEQLDRARTELATFEAMTPEDATVVMAAEYAHTEELRVGYLERTRTMRAQYNRMIERAERWGVPETLAAFKANFVAFLVESRDFDCHVENDDWARAEVVDVDVWRAENLAYRRRAVECAEKALASERARVEKYRALAAAFDAVLPAEGDPNDAPIGSGA